MEGRAKELPKFNFTHLYFSQEVFQLIYDVSKRRSHRSNKISSAYIYKYVASFINFLHLFIHSTQTILTQPNCRASNSDM